MLIRVLACLLVPTQLSAQQPAFIDSHVHLNAPDQWMRLMDQEGIVQSVALAGRTADNGALAAAAARWPGRLLAFASVSPEHREFRPVWMADGTELAPYLDSLLRTGTFAGIGEISVSHYPGSGFPEADFSPAGRTMFSIMEVARRHRVPVLIHCEITRLREFEDLLRALPEVPVIWAHGGYTPLFLAERMLQRHPQLTYELSARSWPEHPRSPDYTILRDGRSLWPEWAALLERYPTRFIVGTDAGGRSETSDRARIASVQNLLTQLSPATRDRIARDNLRQLLTSSTR